MSLHPDGQNNTVTEPGCRAHKVHEEYIGVCIAFILHYLSPFLLP